VFLIISSFDARLLPFRTAASRAFLIASQTLMFNGHSCSHALQSVHWNKTLSKIFSFRRIAFPLGEIDSSRIVLKTGQSDLHIPQLMQFSSISLASSRRLFASSLSCFVGFVFIVRLGDL